MKSLHLKSSKDKPVLVEMDLPRPKPGKGEVLIRVRAAGITPTEVLWYPTSHTKNGDSRNDAVLSHEFSGEVAEIGDGVEGCAVGDEIYGMNDWFDQGALEEYCVSRPEWIALKPQSLDFAAAASVPIGALTAWQGLFDRAKLRQGERVLVHGGAGAVGVFAIQLARRIGAHVISTASARNLEFVRELGADQVIDYSDGPFERKVEAVDVVFDVVGGDTLQRSWSILKDEGRMVTIAADVESSTDERNKSAFLLVAPRHDQLVEIRNLIDAGELRPILDIIVPWTQASAAYDGTVKRNGRGKIVVTV